MAIFINYRRDDDPGYAIALYEKLEKEFGTEKLFMDVEDHIRPGEDFVEVLGARVAQCRVMLTIIGRRWVEILASRANEPQDFVVIEIEAALRQGALVIPVLVGGASIPTAALLPRRIEGLARRQGVELLPGPHFNAGCQRLIASLRGFLGKFKQNLAEKAKPLAPKVTPEAPFVNPEDHYNKVFIFNIGNFQEFYGNCYDATRQAWKHTREMNSGGVAIGLVRGISQGVYIFKKWEKSSTDHNKYIFITEEINRYDVENRRQHELRSRSWKKIIELCPFFKFGGNPVVEFDGRGKFRLFSGKLMEGDGTLAIALTFS